MSESIPKWYQQAVFYQLHVKCFCDSNNDGIGDFNGLTQKLDHVQNLGCNAIWLQPFYPSPLLDDGYDIADYLDIHPNYGTLKDFRKFLVEAHKRDMKVVTELVINHTSDQHAWFQKARNSKPGSKWRNYYMWTDSPEKFQEARIIFKDFENSNWSWDPVAKAYYWHRFYSHQPDLNYDNPEVHKEIFKVVDFWMKMGVDGMRLDAVPYLYAREGTDCENLPETHQFLKSLRKYLDTNFSDRMLLAEANQWPDQAAAYFGEGDECNMAFNFPVMPRLFMAIHLEDRFPIIDIMEQTPKPPEGGQWAIFLRNHDELTLEMVTDEERDFMYRAYAEDPKARINLGIRRRLAPLLKNDRRKIELMNLLLFSLPGSPIVYYGDEIGMGDNYYLGDRDGVRTPMQWNNDRNAGFSGASPQQLYLPLIIDPEYHHAWLNIENQERNLNSLLWWMRKVIAVRRQYEAFGTGNLRFLQPNNLKVLSFVLENTQQSILVVINLSRHCQYVDIDLTEYQNCRLKDLFSQNQFGTVQHPTNSFTLNGYGYFWFLLEKEEEMALLWEQEVPKLHVSEEWERVLLGKEKEVFLNQVLPPFLKKSRWFRSKAEQIKKISIKDLIHLNTSYLVIFEVFFSNDNSEHYLLPLTFLTKEGIPPQGIIAKLILKDNEGYLIDAIYDEKFRKELFDLIIHRKKRKTLGGQLSGTASTKMMKAAAEKETFSSEVAGVEQSNSAIIYPDLAFLKIYRKIEPGMNPEQELVTHLSEKNRFPHIPSYAGALQWNFHQKKTSSTLALLQEHVKNEGDLWSYLLDGAKRYYEEVLSHKKTTQFSFKKHLSLFEFNEIPEQFQNWIGWMVLEKVSLLGRRTAEMHIALMESQSSAEFKPAPFTIFYQKSLYQGFRNQIRKVFAKLNSHLPRLNDESKELAKEVIKTEPILLKKIAPVLDKKISCLKIRTHGDFHLGQILVSGNDLTIIDFEGEPAIPITERKLKRSALQDVTGMVRSFFYAAWMALEQHPNLSLYADYWYHFLSQTYLKNYFDVINSQRHPLVPQDRESLKILFNAYLINKAVYEVGYELQNRPDWIRIPLSGILNIVEELS